MRPKTKERNYWYILAFVAIVLVMLKLVFNGSDSVTMTEVEHPVNAVADLDGAGDFVQVPLSHIMSGKPYVLPQDDARVINYIWSNKHLRPPSDKPYNLKNYNNDPSMGQGQFIRKILKNMTNGFFVECGALDGETRSNTLFMEMHLQWKGLLVEGDPSNCALMEKKNRKAWTANTCLAVKPYPHNTEFRQSFNTGKVLDTEDTSSKHVTVQCMPLFSLLTALSVSTVDYFSLDVEGNELQVLKTIPWDKVYIRTLSVEYIHTEEGTDELLKYMQSQGYRNVGEVKNPLGFANDLMFAHKDVEIDK